MCTKCLKTFKLGEKADNRTRLMEQTGEYFFRKCRNCGYERKYHVNDVKAHPNNAKMLVYTVIGIVFIVVVTLFFWGLGYITTFGFVIGGGFIAAGLGSQRTSSEKAFNSYKIQMTPKSSN